MTWVGWRLKPDGEVFFGISQSTWVWGEQSSKCDFRPEGAFVDMFEVARERSGCCAGLVVSPFCGHLEFHAKLEDANH
jgi:hypothetical protein